MGVAMSNEPGSWAAGKLGSILVLVAVLLPACPPARLPAQVGYDPQHSPFQDIATGQTISTFGGRFFGNRAVAGVGAQGAMSFGARFTTSLSSALELSFTSSVINSQ